MSLARWRVGVLCCAGLGCCPSLLFAVLSLASPANSLVSMDRNLLQSAEHFKAQLCCCCRCGCADPETAPRLNATVTAASVSHLFGE